MPKAENISKYVTVCIKAASINSFVLHVCECVCVYKTSGPNIPLKALYSITFNTEVLMIT